MAERNQDRRRRLTAVALTVAQFRLAFDTERVTDLASDFNDVQQQPVYAETILDAIIAQAIDYVAAQLSKMYSTTQIDADKSMERITADIAMYYLEFRRNQISDDVQSAFERAQRFLAGLQNGTFKLAGVDQLLPIGEESQPTETLEAGEGLFYLDEDEIDLLST